jgi:hypothetical protein
LLLTVPDVRVSAGFPFFGRTRRKPGGGFPRHDSPPMVGQFLCERRDTLGLNGATSKGRELRNVLEPLSCASQHLSITYCPCTGNLPLSLLGRYTLATPFSTSAACIRHFGCDRRFQYNSPVPRQPRQLIRVNKMAMNARSATSALRAFRVRLRPGFWPPREAH